MRSRKSLERLLRTIGMFDARLGKSIDSFYDVPAIRHNESNRAAYEIGYRAAKQELTTNDQVLLKDSGSEPTPRR